MINVTNCTSISYFLCEVKAVERKEHWNNVYATRSPDQVSWYQEVPDTSLYLIDRCAVTKDAAILDVGGGNSRLTGHLLTAGFENIAVLDISEKALQTARSALGAGSEQVEWIAQDILMFQPRPLDLWHDRAAFHFLTDPADIARYVGTAADSVQPGGFLIIGTFSTNGPAKCSGLQIKQYTAGTLESTFEDHFDLKDCLNVKHITPTGKVQDFVFCCFRRSSTD